MIKILILPRGLRELKKEINYSSLCLIPDADCFVLLPPWNSFQCERLGACIEFPIQAKILELSKLG